MIITIKHLRTIQTFNARPGYCLSKTRSWFTEHGLDFRTFVRQGYPEEVLAATGDGLALALIEWAHKCEGTEAGNGRQ